MRFRHAFSFIATLLVLGGCFAKQADLDAVRREQRSMRALLADNQVAVDALKRRVDEMSILMKEKGIRGPGSAGDLERRVAQLEARVAALTSPTAPTSGGEQIGGGLPPSSGSEAIRGTPAAAIAMRSEESVLSTAPADYRAALDLYRQGQWGAAVEKFRQFLQKSPRSELADNAQYWIGECYYNQRDYNRAIIELNEVLLKYPQGNRVPGALLALATAFADSGDPIDARLIVQKLIADYPESEEATIGRQKLQDLTR